MHLVAHREEPAGFTLSFFGNVASGANGGEQLQPCPQKVVNPDGPLGAGHLVPEVHPAPEGPAHLKLGHCTALESDQANTVILCLDGMHQGISPAHDFHGPIILAHEVASDLNAVASHVHDGAAACQFRVPEPGAVRAAVGFARANPQYLSYSPTPHELQ